MDLCMVWMSKSDCGREAVVRGLLIEQGKKITCNCLRLVDFAVGQVDSILGLCDGQVKFFGNIFEEIQITGVLYKIKLFYIRLILN